MAHGFGAGMRRARRMTELRLDRDVSQSVMAQLVTDELKRLGAKKATGDPVTVSQSAWSDYEAERSEPLLITVRATSRVSGVPEAEILFPTPTPPASAIDERHLQHLYDEDLDRAELKVAEPTPSRRAAGKGSRKRPS